jgi:hypothetical protein
LRASGPLPSHRTRSVLQARASATLTLFHPPWSSPRTTNIAHLRNTLALPLPYHRPDHRFHPTFRSSCLTHRRHGTYSHADASHQPRATEPFGGMLARTELQFLRAELSWLRVVCASMSHAVACESSISNTLCGAIAVLFQARHCHRRGGRIAAPCKVPVDIDDRRFIYLFMLTMKQYRVLLAFRQPVSSTRFSSRTFARQARIVSNCALEPLAAAVPPPLYSA